MHFLVVGMSHKTAPVQLRERVSISDVEMDEVLAGFRSTSTILESVVVSTCNRFEVYAIVSSLRAGEDYLQKWLANRCGLSSTELNTHLYVRSGQVAMRHLMNVVSGLDSLVVGETQILGQVRTGFLVASDAGNTGALLNQLFRQAIQLGKRAQTETAIGQNPVSVSYAAVQLAKKILGDLQKSRVLVIGAGKMAQLTVQNLAIGEMQQVCVVNRTFVSAQRLAQVVQGTARPWEDLELLLSEADLVISSTGSPNVVITKQMVKQALSKKETGRPTVFIDIAVPRDIEESCGSLPGVYLYDIDDLEGVVTANIQERERQASQVYVMIDESLADYASWLAEQEVVPLITAIREKGTQIQADVMDSLRHKLPGLDERDLKLIHKHTMSIVNQLLRDPIQNMKELAIASGGAHHVQIFAQLFGVDPALYAKGASKPVLTEGIGFADLVRQWSESLRGNDGAHKVGGPELHPVLR